MLKKLPIIITVLVLLVSMAYGYLYWDEARKFPKPTWTSKERGTIASLWLGNLYNLPEDPSNKVADDLRAAKLGHQIFFDKRFSGNGEVGCVTCHDPDNHFTDGKALAVGMGVTGRSSPTIVGTAYQPFIFWDGRADSHWAQAMGPMESAVEHGGSRMQYAHQVASDDSYRAQYETLFGPLPDLSDETRFPEKAGRVDKKTQPEIAQAWEDMSDEDRETVSRIYSNLGKAIAAYERLLLPDTSRFDDYASIIANSDETPLDILTRDETEGLRLFIGKGRCIECHNGPLFSNDSFANIGTPTLDGKPYDFGRSRGVLQVLKNEFNCTSIYSDVSNPFECSELRFIKRSGDDLIGAMKVPVLRNVTATAPYMHAGQMEDLETVMEHYNKPPQTPFGHNMLTALDLNETQLDQIIAFLHTLDSGIAADPRWLKPPAITATER